MECQEGLAPSNISELLSPYELGSRLGSSGWALLATPRFRLKTNGEGAFAVRAPTLWNSLTEELSSQSPFLVLFYFLRRIFTKTFTE